MNRVFIAIICGLCILSWSQQKYVTTKWEKDSYKEPDSIPVLDYLYDFDEKLFYLLTNDSTNLFVHIKAVDEPIKRKILQFGFTVWIDTLAKNKNHMGVNFPLAKSKPMGGAPEREMGAEKGQRNLEDFRQRPMNEFHEIELIGFKGKGSSEFIPAKNSNTVTGNIQSNSKHDILYTLVIPFESIGLEYAPGKIISLCLESGFLSGDMRQGGQGGPSGGMGGGRSGGMSGGPSGGMGGDRPLQNMQQGMQERDQLATPIKIKIKQLKLL